MTPVRARRTLRRFSGRRSRRRTEWFPVPYSSFVIPPGGNSLTLLDNLVPNVAAIPFSVLRAELSVNLLRPNAATLDLTAAGILVLSSDEAASFAVMTSVPNPLLPAHSYAWTGFDFYESFGTGGANGPQHWTDEGWRISLRQARRLAEVERYCLVMATDAANINNVAVNVWGRLLLSFP